MKSFAGGFVVLMGLALLGSQATAKTFQENFDDAVHRTHITNINYGQLKIESEDLPFFASTGESIATINDCDKIIDTIVEEVFGFENEEIYYGISIWCGTDEVKTNFGYQAYFYGNSLEATKQVRKFINDNQGKEYFGHKFHYKDGLAIIATIKFTHPTSPWTEEPPFEEEGDFPISSKSAFKTMSAYSLFTQKIYNFMMAPTAVIDYIKYIEANYSEFYPEHLKQAVLPKSTGIIFSESFDILTADYEYFSSNGTSSIIVDCQTTSTGFCL